MSPLKDTDPIAIAPIESVMGDDKELERTVPTMAKQLKEDRDGEMNEISKSCQDMKIVGIFFLRKPKPNDIGIMKLNKPIKTPNGKSHQ